MNYIKYLIIDSLKLIEVLSGKDTFREYPKGDQLYDITAIYEVRKYHGNLRINDDESKELKWFDINELQDNLSSMTKNIGIKYKSIF